MILTQCAVCATDLGLTLGKKCGRCSTRYCGPECQVQHWKEGGHDQLCKKIKKAGGAEQFHANTKYAEAVGVAVEACRGRHEGQKCYICLEAVHARTGEGLVRGCACGDRDGVSSPELGVVHVSCLLDQAKFLINEGEENNLDAKVIDARWRRWDTCTLCGKQHHGIVRCALGWACWKTYVGRPETDEARQLAMSQVGNGLYEAGHFEDALSVREAELSTLRRYQTSEVNFLSVQSNVAQTYIKLGKLNDACRLLRCVYSGHLKLQGEEHPKTLLAANNYATSLRDLGRFEDAKSVMRNMTPVAQRVLGGGDEITLRMRVNYAQMVCNDANSTLKDLNMAVDTLEEIGPTVRRVFGISHPFTAIVEQTLQYARAGLRACAILGLEENGLTPADIEKLEKLDVKQEEES